MCVHQKFMRTALKSIRESSSHELKAYMRQTDYKKMYNMILKANDSYVVYKQYYNETILISEPNQNSFTQKNKFSE